MSRPPAAGLLLGQLLVGIYGGYFGAGIGILMLAALGLMVAAVAVAFLDSRP